jgi:lysophospholipase L1-like esterase
MIMKQKTTTYWRRLNVVLVMILSVGTLAAQIKITFPVERAVFQRNNANQATISIGGYYTQPVDRVEARLVPVLTGQGQLVDWTVIQTSPQGGSFLGTLSGRGGWYTLEVRAFQGTTQIGRDALGRVGIGEVFLVAGQSNAQGFFGFGATGAADDRVNAVTWDNQNSDNTANPTLSFAQLTAEMLIGPRGRSAWCWGSLGDLLVKKLNVPVLFMNAGWFDTSTQNWLDAANGKPVLNRLNQLLPAGMPYANLKASLQYYGSILGLRAVLWLQGENDAAAGVPKDAYQNSLQGLINVARIEQGEVLSSLPWVFARTSRYAAAKTSFVSQAIIDAQTAVINIPFNKSYGGPFTDNIQVPRPATNPTNGEDDNVHFQGQGLVQLAQAWDASLPPSFFATVVPVMSRAVLPITITCNTPAVSFNAKAPNGFATYRWTNGETSQVLTIKGAGSYQATMKDNAGNTYLTPPIVVTENVEPPIPVITPNGEQVICADSSLLLTVNVSAVNRVTWSNSFEGRTISVKTPGQYTARLTNIYGCSSTTSAPVTLRTIQLQAPTVTQSSPFSIQANPDAQVFLVPDFKVTNIVWNWRKNSVPINQNTSSLKLLNTNQDGLYSAQSLVTFQSISSSDIKRSCLSPFTPNNQSVPFKFGYIAIRDSSQIPPIFKYEAVGDGEVLNDNFWMVYPNPSRSGLIAIEALKDLTNVNITVASLTGQIVYTEKLSTLSVRKVIDLSRFPEGVYVVKLSSSTLNASKRIIIDY